MEKLQVNDDWNRIYTKEELNELLGVSKGILSPHIIEYLDSLINLELSVIRDEISDNDRMTLSELEVYRKIAMYNIYYRALKLSRESDIENIISEDSIRGLSIYNMIGERQSNLFNYNYQCVDKPIPDGCKPMKIGDIHLFQTIESKEKVKAEIDRLSRELAALIRKEEYYRKAEALHCRLVHSSKHKRICGGLNTQELRRINRDIRICNTNLNALISRDELTEEDKRKIEITQYFNDLLLKDYGLTPDDFENVKSFTKDQSELQKTYVKRKPNIAIYRDINYIG